MDANEREWRGPDAGKANPLPPFIRVNSRSFAVRKEGPHFFFLVPRWRAPNLTFFGSKGIGS